MTGPSQSYAPVDSYEGAKFRRIEGALHTLKVAGIENFSITTSNKFDWALSLSSPLTIKYFGSLNPKAASFPGSWVRVAENNSFWQDVDFVSGKKAGIYGCDRPSKTIGEQLSGRSAFQSELSFRLSSSEIEGCDRVAAST